MTEFVDKRWQDKGIDTYSTEAILSTLRHYGVSAEAEALKSDAVTHYPLAWVKAWHGQWKGLGQFARFPGAAAQELWRRFRPEALAPTDLALSLAKLCENADEALAKKNESTLLTRFEVAERLASKMPERSEQRDEFMEELVMALGDWSQAIDHLPAALLRGGMKTEAERLVQLDEKVFEVREGISSALLLEANGARDAALSQLSAVAQNAERHVLNRLHACETLFHLDAYPIGLRGLESLVTLVCELKNRAWASEVGATLMRAAENKNTQVQESTRAMMKQLVAHFEAPAA
jgi:hypothetical protein